MASVDALDHGEKKDNYASSSDSEGEDAVPSSAPPPVSDGLPQVRVRSCSLVDTIRPEMMDRIKPIAARHSTLLIHSRAFIHLQTGPKGVLTDFYRQQYEDLQQQAENDKKTRAEIERKAPTVKTWVRRGEMLCP